MLVAISTSVLHLFEQPPKGPAVFRNLFREHLSVAGELSKGSTRRKSYEGYLIVSPMVYEVTDIDPNARKVLLKWFELRVWIYVIMWAVSARTFRHRLIEGGGALGWATPTSMHRSCHCCNALGLFECMFTSACSADRRFSRICCAFHYPAKPV